MCGGVARAAACTRRATVDGRVTGQQQVAPVVSWRHPSWTRGPHCNYAIPAGFHGPDGAPRAWAIVVRARTLCGSQKGGKASWERGAGPKQPPAARFGPAASWGFSACEGGPQPPTMSGGCVQDTRKPIGHGSLAARFSSTGLYAAGPRTPVVRLRAAWPAASNPGCSTSRVRPHGWSTRLQQPAQGSVYPAPWTRSESFDHQQHGRSTDIMREARHPGSRHCVHPRLPVNRQWRQRGLLLGFSNRRSQARCLVPVL
jgi:hypothetical protein